MAVKILLWSIHLKAFLYVYFDAYKVTFDEKKTFEKNFEKKKFHPLSTNHKKETLTKKWNILCLSTQYLDQLAIASIQFGMIFKPE